MDTGKKKFAPTFGDFGRDGDPSSSKPSFPIVADPEQRQGIITAIGSDTATVLLDFRPRGIYFDIQGQTADPFPFSNDPSLTDKVVCSFQETEQRGFFGRIRGKGDYKLVFTWTVFGTKTISWYATS